MIVYCITKC